MLVTTSHSLPRLLVLPVFLFICGAFFFFPRQYHGSAAIHIPILTGKNLTAASSTFDKSVQEFWSDLATALVDAQPQCEPLQLDDEGFDDIVKFKPLEPHRTHPDRLVNFTKNEELALFRAHYTMRSSAKELASKVPFAQGTTGIVTTANAMYMPIFLVSLRLLRKTGCDLPMEVFIDDWSKYDATVCETVLPSLNARCVVLSNIYETAANAKPPSHYQYKAFAILFSSFQHVLFLDSDAFPSQDPKGLFSVAPYTTHGLVTWPDFWAQTISAHFYHIAAIPEVPSQSRLSTESGQLLMNKDLHRETLLMMVYYNYYGPDFYYILFSQGAPGAGDKETFTQAALAVGLPFYQVRTTPMALGRFLNGTYEGTAIAQADPRLDYQYLPPMRNHIHDQALWQDKDLVSQSQRNKPRTAPSKPIPLFIHQNNLKLDPAYVLNDKRPFDMEGHSHRLWGKKEDMQKQLGYDVEQRMWEVVVEEGCREDARGEKCRKLRGWYRDVFGQVEVDMPLRS
ncbi:glycosyltransferase family 71 protein [Bipolaris oryzae ATCC 44560]|uniref:Glycosyltransferase family 71 protein n=1 Tax=Bipolaris oryzae ATCC 44560 TaxID=930090 RepID=W6ZR84_COCMI|nr:glycosyltransferase family 71 protein [Bipolaris oryzae ATCC 44560]EUC46171.1 glycosyltransferase family 71 protein [Bipolaris oryzae ATCC 44560]